MMKSRISAWSRLRLLAHRSLAKGGLYQFLIYAVVCVALCGITALCLVGVNMEDLSEHSYSEPESRFAIAFFHLFNNGGQNLLGNQPYGWFITTAGILLVAVITSLFTNLFDKTAQRYLDGRTHYRIRGHVAVFGYHDMLPGLIRQLISSGYGNCIFLVQTDKVDQARDGLSRALTRKQMRKVILQNGDLSSEVDLPMMRIGCASEIFIMGEEMMLGGDSSHDTEVLQCLENIVAILPEAEENSRKVICHVMFEHHSTFAVFQHTDLNRKVFGKLAFMPFNYYEMWARKVFVNDSLHPEVSPSRPYLPLEGRGGIGADSEDHVHLMVIGMSRMGVALGMQAAHLGHYPNFNVNPSLRTRITFIDINAREEMHRMQGGLKAMFQTARWRFCSPSGGEYGYGCERIGGTPWLDPLSDKSSASPFKSRSRHLGKDFIDVEWEFIQGDAEHPAIQEYIREAAEDPHARLTVAVCLPDTNQAIAVGLNLPPAVYKSAVQVLIYQRNEDSIVKALSEGSVSGFAPYSRIRSFGMSSCAYDLGLVTRLAYAAGSLNRDGAPTLRELLVADAEFQMRQASKSKSAAANMWSNIYNASHMWTKLRSVGSEDGTIPDSMVEMLGKTEHVRWNVEQLLTRFRPLTEEEQAAVLAGKATKDGLKREKFAHLDIVSCDRLARIDPEAVPWDSMLVRNIPGIYRRLKDYFND